MADQLGGSKSVKENAGSSSQHEEADQNTQIVENVNFLELPENLPFNILSRLPLETIFQCKSVSKTLNRVLSDPYFPEVHLTMAPQTTPALIVSQDMGFFSHVSMYVLDIDQPSPATSSSVNAIISITDQLSRDQALVVRHPSLTGRTNVKFCSLVSFNVTTVGSCNGLVCYFSQFEAFVYYVCNPLLAEYIVLPRPTPSTPDYTYLNHSGFGFCPKSKTYKVIRFMSRKSVDANMVTTWTPMADVHTLGTQSWRSIEGARVPKQDGSFDASLNGIFHWITDSQTPSDLISSFELHTEKFRVIPPPAHFKRDYIAKISGLKIGSLKGSLCLAYVSENVDQFTVWVMKDYGVKDSWTKHFSIDINFFVDLQVDDFDRPVKFAHNGDLWLMTRLDSLISYSPENKTFKELSALGTQWWTRVIPHVPSLISLTKAVAGGQNQEPESIITIHSMGSFNGLVTRGMMM